MGGGISVWMDVYGSLLKWWSVCGRVGVWVCGCVGVWGQSSESVVFLSM